MAVVVQFVWLGDGGCGWLTGDVAEMIPACACGGCAWAGHTRSAWHGTHPARGGQCRTRATNMATTTTIHSKYKIKKEKIKIRNK